MLSGEGISEDEFYSPPSSPSKLRSANQHKEESTSASETLNGASSANPSSSGPQASDMTLSKKHNREMIDKPSKSMQQKQGNVGLGTQQLGSEDATATKHDSAENSSEEDGDKLNNAPVDDPFHQFREFSLEKEASNDKDRTHSAVSPSERPDDPFSEHPSTQLTKSQRFVLHLAQWLDKVNFLPTRRALRAPEICDFSWAPDIVRSTTQNILTREWTRKLPLIQINSPAFVASGNLASVINEVSKQDTRELEVFEFCAGGGGPTPEFERLINQQRQSVGDAPIQFSISDKYPNPKAWALHTSHSRHLRAIEESVDAIDPPSVARSVDSKRVFRLFNLSFHHFGDKSAVEILRSTMETADGIAIVELQDRRVGCLLMMLMNFFFVLWTTPTSYPPPENRQSGMIRNLFRNVATYWSVVFTLVWDGTASCLRTREFKEVVKLVKDAAEAEEELKINVAPEDQLKLCTVGPWTFKQHARQLHTFPFGYVNMITGVRKPNRARNGTPV